MLRLSLNLPLVIAMLLVATASEAAPPSGTSKKLEAIPLQFHGTWDADADACKLVASDMRYYIGPSGMRFGDSVGTVRRVIRRERQSITVDASFLSDGDPWDGWVRLSLSSAGDELTVEAGETRATRHRCRSRS